MKNTLLFLFFNFLLLNAHSTHLMGWYIGSEPINDTTYRIKVYVWRDCNSSTPFDGAPGAVSDLVLGVFQLQSQTAVTTMSLVNPAITSASDSFLLNCPGNYCIEQAVYETEISLPTSDDYLLVYERCCLTGAITNIFNAGDYGFTMSTQIHGNLPNSSPVALKPVQQVAPINQELVYKNWCADPDGDSLRFELGEIITGGSAINPVPNPPQAPVDSFLAWTPGYSAFTPFGNDTVFLDSITGELRVTPHTQGVFLLNIIAKEYRNDTLIGKNSFYMSITVSDCQYNGLTKSETEFINLYPNPVTDVLQINTGWIQPADIFVFDPLGRCAYKKSISGPISINTEDWAKGIYLVRITGANNTFRYYKVVKE